MEKIGDIQRSQTGKMPSFDSPRSICFNCKTSTWVMAVGRDDSWDWNCVNCVVFDNKHAREALKDNE